MRLTVSEIDRRLHGRGISRLCENTFCAKKSTFKCTCGHVWQTRLGAVINKGRNGKPCGCPNCKSNRPMTRKEAEQKLSLLGYELDGGWVNAATRATFKCRRGHTWVATPDNVFRGRGCPHCSGRVKYTRETLNEKIAHKHIRLVGELENVNKRALFECKCGHVWEATPASIIHVSACPKCAKYGFSSNEPAYFYSLHIISDSGDEFVGFGITKDIETRFRAHARALSHEGMKCEVLDLYHFDYGGDARALESIVKENVRCVDIGVAGFRREAIVADDYMKMFNLMESLKICAC